MENNKRGAEIKVEDRGPVAFHSVDRDKGVVVIDSGLNIYDDKITVRMIQLNQSSCTLLFYFRKKNKELQLARSLEPLREVLLDRYSVKVNSKFSRSAGCYRPVVRLVDSALLFELQLEI